MLCFVKELLLSHKNLYDILLSYVWSWCPHVRIMFYRHLRPSTCGHVYGTWFSLEDKRGLSLGELIRPFCIMFSCWYLSLLWLLFHFTVLFLCLFSLILQGLHEEGEYRQLEFWPESGAKLRYLFCATPNAVKINEDFFPDLSKILGRRSARGAPGGAHKPAWRGHPPGRAMGACG